MSLDPVIFESRHAFEEAVDKACAKLREADAKRFRILAEDYELQTLKEPQFSYEAGKLEGQAGGLRIAAALLESAVEVPA